MPLETGKQKQFLLMGSTLLLFVVVVSFFSLEQKIKKENALLIRLLNGEYARTFINGEAIDIVNGVFKKDHLDIFEQNQGLRSGWYQTIHRVSPLYALPGTDLEVLKKTTLKLEEAMRETLDYAKTLHEKELLENLHPFNFLQKLSDLEQHRREMLSHPDELRIQQYHFALLNTINLYQKETGRYRKLLSTIPTSPPLIFFYHESSKAHLEKAFEKLTEESMAILKEEERRFECYRGLAHSCSEIPHPILGMENIPIKKTATFSPEILSFLKKWYDPTFIKQPFYKTESLPKTMKTVVTSAARCFPEIPSSFLYIELKNTEYDLIAAKTETLSELFFYKIKTESLESFKKNQEHQRYLTSLVTNGHTIQYQPFNLYTCLESGYDESRVLSIIEMYSLAKNHPLGEKINGDEGKKLNLLEKEFGTTDYLSDQVAKSYIAHLSKLVAKKDFRIKMIEEGKGKTLQEAEERIVLWQSQTAGYEKTVAYALTLNRPILFYVRDHNIPPSELFILRSYPSVFFLPFNRTISQQAVFFSTKTTPIWEKKQRFRDVIPFTRGFPGNPTIEGLLEVARSEQNFIQKSRNN